VTPADFADCAPLFLTASWKTKPGKSGNKSGKINRFVVAVFCLPYLPLNFKLNARKYTPT